MKKRLLFFNVVVLFICFYLTGCDLATEQNRKAAWDETRFGPGGGYDCDGLAIGTCKGDGVNRIYVTHNIIGYENDKIFEYTFQSGQWKGDLIHTSQSTNSIQSIRTGNARNDGMQRLYFDQYNMTPPVSCSLHELTFSEGDWELCTVDSVPGGRGSLRNTFTLGAGRQDGVQRIYWIAENGHIREYTYVDSAWSCELLGPAGQEPLDDLVIGTARNDGINRMYAGSHSGHIYEFDYAAGEWAISDIGMIKYDVWPNDFISLAAGSGRSDGVHRIYAGIGQHDGFWEFSYHSDGFWEKDSLKGCGDVEDLTIGSGKNDAIHRVYIAGDGGNLREYRFLNNAWELTTHFSATSFFTEVTVGRARDDTRKRVYGATTAGYVYEYTYQP